MLALVPGASYILMCHIQANSDIYFLVAFFYVLLDSAAILRELFSPSRLFFFESIAIFCHVYRLPNDYIIIP